MADKTAVIEFDEYPGKSFTVRLSPVPMDPYLDIGDRLKNMRTNDDMRELVQRFADLAMVGWEGYDGEPTADNMRAQLDFNLIPALITQWSNAIAQAPLPLPRTSGAGGPSKVRRASKSRRS